MEHLHYVCNGSNHARSIGVSVFLLNVQAFFECCFRHSRAVDKVWRMERRLQSAGRPVSDNYRSKAAVLERAIWRSQWAAPACPQRSTFRPKTWFTVVTFSQPVGSGGKLSAAYSKRWECRARHELHESREVEADRNGRIPPGVPRPVKP